MDSLAKTSPSFFMLNKEAAWYMLQELKEQRLEVIKYRKVISENPEWYRKLCSQYMTSRKRYPKLRTYIKRCHVIRVLTEISKGLEKDTVYHQRLATIMEEYIEHHTRMY